MAGSYALVNNTTITDGSSGTITEFTNKYQRGSAFVIGDTEIYYQGLSAHSFNINRQETRRDNSILFDTNSGSAITHNDGYVVSMWVFHPFINFYTVEINNATWGGIQIGVSDGGVNGNNNSNTYRVDGQDVSIKCGWQLYVVDLRNTPTGPDSNLSVGTGGAGREPRYLGWTTSHTGVTLRRNPLGALDCIRYGRMELQATGGTSSSVTPSDPVASSAANVTQLAEYDDYNAGGTPTNGSAVDGGYHKFGICEPSGFRESNGYILRGIWSLGTASTSTYFEDYNSQVNIRDCFVTYDDFNRIEIRNSSSTVKFIGGIFSFVLRPSSVPASIAPSTPRGNLEVIDNATVELDACSFVDMGTFIFQTNTTVTDTSFRRCDLVTQGGAILTNVTFDESRVDVALLSTVATASSIDGCVFKGDNTSHAVNLGTVSSDTTINWNSTFVASTYAASSVASGATSTSGDSEVILVNVASGQTLTISVTGTSPTYRNTGSGTVLIVNEVQVTIFNVIEGSEVRMWDYTNANTDIEIAGGVESIANTDTLTTGSVTFNVAANLSVLVKVFNTDLNIEKFVLDSGSGTTRRVDQKTDRVYSNP